MILTNNICRYKIILANEVKVLKKKTTALILSLIMTLELSSCVKEITNETKEAIPTTTSVATTYEETTEQTTIKEEVLYKDKDDLVYATTDLNLRKEDNKKSDVVTVIDEYNKIRRIKTNGKWDYVKYKDNYGYVSSKYTKKLTSTFVEVDLSSQKLKLYKDESKIFTCDVVTGLKGVHDTRHGCNPIYSRAHENKNTSRGIELRGRDPGDQYSVYVYYWMAFDGGQGIHDADNWRYGNYGGDIYKTSGSHGCVSVCYSDAEYIYEHTKKGDYVLVHE